MNLPLSSGKFSTVRSSRLDLAKRPELGDNRLSADNQSRGEGREGLASEARLAGDDSTSEVGHNEPREVLIKSSRPLRKV